jgi:site-specific DNA-methyltransferase (adenine-specific)/modification methylase
MTGGGVSLHLGACLDVIRDLDVGTIAAVITDPPYGINYCRSSNTGHGVWGRRNSQMPIEGDDRPFDPTPWLRFPCIIWGADHFAANVPGGGTWLAWDKALDRGPDDSFTDCEFAWCSRSGVKRNICRCLWKGIACIKAGETNGRRWHPTQKPIALMRWCIETLGIKPGETILDPYMGCGSTGIAALQLGCNFVGIEKHEPYFRIAERRIAREREQSKLFV